MKFRTPSAAIQHIATLLSDQGSPVPVSHWQGMDVTDKPEMITHELTNVLFTTFIPENLDMLKKEVKPNLPWADDHFLERVGGMGLNPGEQYKNWPYYRRQVENDQHRVEQGKFSHTYMERIWPNNTDDVENLGLGKLLGIRYHYGDLNDVIDLLHKHPLTRQAFLPIWYPEDTGAVHGGRVPCTLGYHFLLRNNRLHITYPIRACDFFRHFRDDIYLACRLGMWVLDQLRKRDRMWNDVEMGQLHMHIYSLHVFINEVPMLRKVGR